MTIYFYSHTKKEDDEKDYRWMSNFYPSTFNAEGIEMKSSEQYFMWRKALTMGDKEIAEKILESDTPDEAKALGRKVKGYDDELWSKVSYDIMVEGLRYKFRQNRKLARALLATYGEELAEAAKYDKKWGIGLTPKQARDGAKWNGQNLLGKALMQVRSELLGEE
jgi:ribA/ribD-fused uncharacterized protein